MHRLGANAMAAVFRRLARRFEIGGEIFSKVQPLRRRR